MRLLKDDHTVEIDGHTVAVTGTTGPVHATWTLLIEDEPADTAKAAGDFMLRGTLPNGSAVEAAVHQSLVGPTEFVIRHQGEDVRRFTGFVA
ncbi:MAG: hypothetical protein ACRDMY_04040 [Gaiellaceae bacterium]